MATQEELRRHCIEVLGMTEESIGSDEIIPQGMLLIGNSTLTEADKEWARTIVRGRVVKP